MCYCEPALQLAWYISSFLVHLQLHFLVVLSPELILMYWFTSKFFALFSSCTTLMSPNCYWVYTKVLAVNIFFQMLKYLVKNSFITPFTKTWIHNFPWAKTFGKISPRHTTEGNPQYGIKHQTSIFAWTSFFSFGKYMFCFITMIIWNFISSLHGKSSYAFSFIVTEWQQCFN